MKLRLPTFQALMGIFPNPRIERQPPQPQQEKSSMIISPDWYPNLPTHPDSTSKEFQYVLDWLSSHGAPLGCFVQTVSNGVKVPDQIEFTRNNDTHSFDAIKTFLNPQETLIELQQAFGFGDPRFQVPFSMPSADEPPPAKPGPKYKIGKQAAMIGPNYYYNLGDLPTQQDFKLDNSAGQFGALPGIYFGDFGLAGMLWVKQ
jgi:hypothetical protein